VNGQIKESPGLGRLLLGGTEKENGDWRLMAARRNPPNLSRLHRSPLALAMGTD
jgi:hypothetical protein